MLGLVVTWAMVGIGCAAPSSSEVGPSGGGGQGGAPPSGPPPGWKDAIAATEASDRNPDPRVVELDLEARVAALEIRPGTTTPAWTYDGRIPGPVIRARVGDRVIVHFTNRLPEPTTIHWHGLRVPVAMDGVPGVSQMEVEPGGTFTYDFLVPDAGTFWYHPHVRSAKQVGDGLYGAFVVEDPNEPFFGDELVAVLSDMSVANDGSLRPPDLGGDIATLFGREGDLILVNGRWKPTLLARDGRPQRWRLVNAARSRYFEVALAGHTFARVGGDGGLLPAPITSERFMISPGERADVVVVPRGEAGDLVPVRWVPYDRGFGSTFRRPEEPIIDVRFADMPPEVPPPLPATGRLVPLLDTAGATPFELRLTRNDVGNKFALGINGVAGGGDALPGHVGETQVWTVVNDLDWAHPFHLHGFFFQVLGDDGLPLPEWKDTANVPQKGTLRIVVRYDDRPGMWMFHCHILDHADAGMMGMLHLER